MNLNFFKDQDEAFVALYERGFLVKRRDKGIIKCLYNSQIKMVPGVLKTYKSRPISIEYMIDELKWYIDYKDPNIDENIKKYTIWKNLFEKGKINSNYGRIALPQLNYVIEELKKDKFTTRAVIYYGSQENLKEIHNLESDDMICTIAMHFYHSVDNYLNATVYMRSSDIIYGFFYDFIWASFLYEKILKELEGSKRGFLLFQASNLHVYEKHFQLLENIYKEIKEQ